VGNLVKKVRTSILCAYHIRSLEVLRRIHACASMSVGVCINDCWAVTSWDTPTCAILCPAFVGQSCLSLWVRSKIRAVGHDGASSVGVKGPTPNDHGRVLIQLPDEMDWNGRRMWRRRSRASTSSSTWQHPTPPTHARYVLRNGRRGEKQKAQKWRTS
jgi:hypothetical protein